MARRHFKTWADFEAHLEKLGFFHMELGLERIGAALDSLGLRRLACPTVQVVGTNGKGSTSSFLASIARAHGCKTALYTSPHFVSVRERLRIFEPGGSLWGNLLPEERWLEAAEAVMQAGGKTLTYFELITVMSIWLAREKRASLAVLESGLGGRWDAVSAMQTDLTIFTPIALDHCAVLGESVQAIARDKAGAMRKAALAVSATQTEEASLVLAEEAQKKGVNLSFATDELPEGFPGLGIAGEHQRGNAALALAAWHLIMQKMRLGSKPAAEAQGLFEARIPGRMQFIQASKSHPPIIVDGAHNAHGLAALGHSLARRQIAPAAIIFNCMRDKNPEALIPHLRALSTGPIFVPAIHDNPRAMPPTELASLIGLAAAPAPDMALALRLATATMSERLPEERYQDIHECKHPLLICGSLYLLGDFFALYPEYLTKDPV